MEPRILRQESVHKLAVVEVNVVVDVPDDPAAQQAPAQLFGLLSALRQAVLDQPFDKFVPEECRVVSSKS